jgi:hypothetical protein
MVPPSMTGDPTADQIEQLKRLHARWMAEFRQIRTDHPDRAAHLWEALQDLERLIVELTIERSHEQRPRAHGITPSF